MDTELAWSVIAAERSALASILRDLTPEQWERPSLCDEWSVRDVAAHVIAWPDTGVGDAVAALVRAGGNYNRMIRDQARRRAARPTPQILADFDRLSGSRRHPPAVGHHEGLVDVLVHTQDIAIPMGLVHPMPLEAARDCATRWWRIGFPFHARHRLRGHRLVADDVEWSRGSGSVVEGPISSLLLLITGRPAALDTLHGDGAEALRAAVRADR